MFRPTKRNEVTFRANKEECRRLNRELSKRRVTIEHVFADLKTFRIVRDIFPSYPDQFDMVFKAVALIHNVDSHRKGYISTEDALKLIAKRARYITISVKYYHPR